MSLGGGKLYLVGTPIGNLADMSYRAVDILKSVDLIACEDTRHSKILLDHYQITKPLVSYFDHSERSKAPKIIEKIKNGSNVALISDAGMPGIADPGYRLIREAIDQNIAIECIPGPCALTTALVLSGLPTHAFIFEGFMPIKDSQKKKILAKYKEDDEDRTIIFYESPHRIVKTLAAIEETLGDIPIVVARELTKKFEETRRQPVSLLRQHFENTKPLGEFVLLINVNQSIETSDST